MKLRWSLALWAAAVSSTDAFTAAPFVTHNHHRRSTTFLMAVKRLPDSAVELSIPVPGEATQAAYDKVVREVSKSVQIPGFRKGAKIPPQVLEQAMAAKGGRHAMKVQAINELANTLIEPTLKAESLDPIGQPILLESAEALAETFTPGQELTLQIKCDVWPDIDWKASDNDSKPYVGLQGKYRRQPFNQDRMDKALADLKERYASLELIDDSDYVLQMGDACTVNMVGYMANVDGSKGEPLPNAASGDRVDVVLGEGRYMEGLVEGLVGAKVGQTQTVTVRFPEVGVGLTGRDGLCPWMGSVLDGLAPLTHPSTCQTETSRQDLGGQAGRL